MATVNEAICSILNADAQITTSGCLGNLLGKYTTKPYGVYFINPPNAPIFPIITYSEVAASGRMPVTVAINFTAWGNNYEAILNRIYILLHEKIIGSTTGLTAVQIMWNWSGPVIFDENFKVHAQTHRYLVYGVKS